jgi:hypothetical protein
MDSTILRLSQRQYEQLLLHALGLVCFRVECVGILPICSKALGNGRKMKVTSVHRSTLLVQLIASWKLP